MARNEDKSASELAAAKQAAAEERALQGGTDIEGVKEPPVDDPSPEHDALQTRMRDQSVMGAFERAPEALAPPAGLKTWKFEVSVINIPSLPKLVIEATDETEAIRLYALRCGSGGRALDTVKCRWRIKGLDNVERMKVAYETHDKRYAELNPHGPRYGAVAVG